MLDQFDNYEAYERPIAKEMYICSNCGDVIHEGECFWDLEQGITCEECIENMREVAE